MALLSTTNLTFDLYRGYAATTPYIPPNRPAASSDLQGILKHHVRCGRFGYRIPGQNNVPIYWTNVLLIPTNQQIRDGYNSELNSFTVGNGDTVMAYDYPNLGDCCAFVVVMVQRRSRGTFGDHFRCYLDRAQPTWNSSCPDPSQGGSVINTCCPEGLPATLHASVSDPTGTNCPCVNPTTITLTYHSTGNYWLGTATLGTCLRQMSIHLACAGSYFYVNIDVSDGCAGPWSDVRGTLVSCSPFDWSASFVYDGIGTCHCPHTPASLTITVTE